MEQKRKSQINTTHIILFGIGIFWAILGFVTPLTGDDWTWGSQIGLNRLANGYVGYNGRILSNTLEIIISRSTLIRVILFTVINTLLVYFVVNIAVGKDKAKPWHYLLATGLFTTISTSVYAQSFGWFAGFINYILGALVIFVYCHWIATYHPISLKVKAINYIGMFVLGVASALIIEHVTFYLLCLSLMAFLYLRKSRRQLRLNVAYFSGIVVGGLIMFLNPSYVRVFTGHDTLRHTAHNGLFSQAITMYTNQMAKYVFQQNGLLLLVLSMGIIILMYRDTRGNRLLKGILSSYLLGYSVFAAFIRNLFPTNNFNMTVVNEYLAVGSVFYIAVLVVTIFAFIQEKELKLRLCFYIVSALLLSAPFVAITPYGPRCAFNTVAFIILAAIDVINVVVSNDQSEISNVFEIFGVVSMAFMLVTMGMNGHVNHARVAVIKTQLARHAKVVYVRKLPFEQFLWDSSPARTRFQYSMYKRRMHIQKNQKLIYVPYSQWQSTKWDK
ncbi:DUF6056 family protein [Lactiplantibacillus pentosus]|uniref:DUF6056 family protein n=2 Tax=Lactiplantibacillus pentosus TaxID=1589 RepID=UPI001EB49578|nr:DUF6056 family protein [Lactiplantibacillus pentosus]MDY1543344.1 DUF6056 family protein [Lactiplantibacillus pentosus]